MSDIIAVDIPDVGGKQFFITYKESAVENVTVEYEAMTGQDRNLIVYKLEFILGLEDRSKIVKHGGR